MSETSPNPSSNMSKYALRSPLMKVSRTLSSYTPRSIRKSTELETSCSEPGQPTFTFDEEADFRFLDNFAAKISVNDATSSLSAEQKDQEKSQKLKRFTLKSPSCLRKKERQKSSPCSPLLKVEEVGSPRSLRSSSLETSSISISRALRMSQISLSNSQTGSTNSQASCGSSQFDFDLSMLSMQDDTPVAECTAVEEAIAANEEQRRVAESITRNISKLKKLAAEFTFLNTTNIREIEEEKRRLTELHHQVETNENIERACIASLDYITAVSDLSTALHLEESQVLEMVGEIEFDSNVFFSKVHPRAVAKLRDSGEEREGGRQLKCI